MRQSQKLLFFFLKKDKKGKNQIITKMCVYVSRGFNMLWHDCDIDVHE